MNGAVLPGTNIAVDFWKIRNLPYTSLTFFLTHLHGDHIAGLTSSWAFPIYCTEITATLLEKRHGIDSSILRALEVNESHIITREESEKTFTVTVIDANHCPGAAMFLFEGDFGTILHTGDFRYQPSMLEPTSLLSSHIANIDVVYLDNTFCSPQCLFPSREIIREEILRIVQKHPNHDIVLGVRKLGKEDLLVWLAQELQEWISVSGQMFEVAELLDMPRVFRVQDNSCRVRAVPFQMVCKRNMVKWNSTQPTIAILPTSIYTGIGGRPFANQDDVFVVPYSDHSSYAELEEFVSRLQPASIVPIVSADSKGPFNVCLKSRADMTVFDRYCVPGNKRLREYFDDNAQTWKSCVPSKNHRRKPTLRKQKSNPILKKPVLKGVHFDSPDKDSSETIDRHCKEISTINRPDQPGCVVIETKEDETIHGKASKRNNYTEEHDEVLASQGFDPRVLFNYGQSDKENRLEDPPESSLLMEKISGTSEAIQYIYLSDGGEDSCADKEEEKEEEEEMNSPEKGSINETDFSVGTSKHLTLPDKETVVYCSDVSEDDRSDGGPTPYPKGGSRARTDVIVYVTKKCTSDSTRNQTSSEIQAVSYSPPAIVDDLICSVVDADNTNVRNSTESQIIVENVSNENLEVCLLMNVKKSSSLRSRGSISSSELPATLGKCEIQNENLKNHSVRTVRKRSSVHSSDQTLEPTVHLKHYERLVESLGKHSESTINNSKCIGGLVSSLESPVKSLKKYLKSNRDDEKIHCPNEVTQLLIEEIRTPNKDSETEDVQSPSGDTDCETEDIFSPNEETQCPLEEIQNSMEETPCPSEEDIFVLEHNGHSDEKAQVSPDLRKSTNAEQSPQERQFLDGDDSSDDEKILRDKRSEEEEVILIEEHSEQKKPPANELTRLKIKQNKICSLEKNKLSRVNEFNGSMLTSQIGDVSHQKSSNRNARSVNLQDRAKSVECLRVKPLKIGTPIPHLSLHVDKARTNQCHTESELKNTRRLDSASEKNEIKRKQTCVTNLEERFTKRKSLPEENSKYFSQLEPVIDLTKPQIQVQSKVNTFITRRRKEATKNGQTSTNSPSDSKNLLTQQPSIQRGMKRKCTESFCDFCGCQKDVSCSCSTMNCLKRRCNVSESYFAKSSIWFSVKPLTSLTDLERRKRSQKDTIASLHNWLDRH